LLDWDWAAGEEELQKSIHLDKSDPVGHLAYGIHLACRGGQESQWRKVERALRVDPASCSLISFLGWIYGICHDMTKHRLSIRWSRDWPPIMGAASWVGHGLRRQGQFTDAIAHLTNATQMKCGSLLHGQMGYCYAMAGRAMSAAGDRNFEGSV